MKVSGGSKEENTSEFTPPPLVPLQYADAENGFGFFGSLGLQFLLPPKSKHPQGAAGNQKTKQRNGSATQPPELHVALAVVTQEM